MDLVERLATGAQPDELFAVIVDLRDYPDWLGLVVRAEPEEPRDDDPVWMVELRGQVGPLARSKRLRMVRTELDPPKSVTFERREIDGRDHSHWILRASVLATESGSDLTVRLHYGGRLLGPVLERVLRDEIRRARVALAERFPVVDP